MLPTILLVDDEPELIYFLERTLRPHYTIVTASNGKEALGMLEVHAVQLVVSDVMMPELDGYELCKSIKSNLEHSHIPVILLTAKNTLQSKVEGLQLGADAYIEKPFSKEHLMAQIASLLANRNMVRQYFAQTPMAALKSIAHTRADERFLEKLNQTILEHLEDCDLDVEKLASMLNMTRMTLYRKIKAISNLTPAELINLARLKKAAELLASGQYRIYEVAGIVGFSSQSNMARNFQKQFNMSPSDYISLMQAEQQQS